MKIKCIAIDDEPLALYVIKEHVERLSFLELVATCSSAIEAMTILSEQEIDLIFLDIQMPELSGIEFIKSLSHKPAVIFTTTYPDFALQSYELDATDYLLKPISFERFVKAVNKLVKTPSSSNSAPTIIENTSKNFDNEYIFVKTDYKNVKIYLKDVLYVEGLKEYVVFHLEDEKIISLLKMKTIEEQLPSDQFVRVHRSYIVSLSKIDFTERNRIQINDQWIPIGMSYKAEFDKIINAKKLE